MENRKPARRPARETEKRGGRDFKSSKPVQKAPLKQARPVSKGKQNALPEIRLNRFIANSGVCSRRDADEHIKNGLITVNGRVVTDLGAKVTL